MQRPASLPPCSRPLSFCAAPPRPASPDDARNMPTVFAVLPRAPRAGNHVPLAQWQEFLRSAFAPNMPYDQLVRALLAADGSDPKPRPAARFYLDREGEAHLLT